MKRVSGRFELVDAGQDFLVAVDYAHTPDSLKQVIQAAREITKGRIITVFGCTGERDKEKALKIKEELIEKETELTQAEIELKQKIIKEKQQKMIEQEIRRAVEEFMVLDEEEKDEENKTGES